MLKKMVVFGLAAALLVCSGFASWAAVCSSSNSPDGAHHFNVHKTADAGYSVRVSECRYLYGHDANNNPIYHTDCVIYDQYQYCNYICRYCNKIDDTQGAHNHYVRTRHTINHN